MSVANSIPEAVPSTATAPKESLEQEFHWQNCWYPISFVQDLPKNRPYSFSLYNEPLVLFRNQEGKLVCLTDRCPHRAAKLSDGQIIDGKLECLYHGWQFGAEGKCLHIPQLAAELQIPATACVGSFSVVEKQGIVWMWAGEAEAADEQMLPTIDDVDKPNVVTKDYMIDLPYDQTYFIENVLDPAHVPISHNDSVGNRQDAQPLGMEVVASSALGIRGQYWYAKAANQKKITLDFIAPNLVMYRADYPQGFFLTALYTMPTEKGKCRHLLRYACNFVNWYSKLTPRWFDHLLRSQIQEEDAPFIMAQQNYIERSGKSIKEVYFPLKTSDVLVLEYRKWLDKFGVNMPFYQGYTTSTETNPQEDGHPLSIDRYKHHTQICTSCSNAHRTSILVKQITIGVAIALAAVALTTQGLVSQVAVLGAILAVIGAFVANLVKTKLERSYTRH